MHGSSFKDRHLVQSDTLAMHTKELLKLNNTINIYLVRLNIILYCYSLNTCKCLICKTYQ